MHYYIIDFATRGQDWQSDRNESLRHTLNRAAKYYAEQEGYHSIKSIYCISHDRERVITGRRLGIIKRYFDKEIESWENLTEDYILRGIKP